MPQRAFLGIFTSSGQLSDLPFFVPNRAESPTADPKFQRSEDITRSIRSLPGGSAQHPRAERCPPLLAGSRSSDSLGCPMRRDR